MSKRDNKEIYRVLDVNLNRAREGLRVCEDTARFVLKKEDLCRKIKRLRHAIGDAISASDLKFTSLIKFRDVQADFGKTPDILEQRREDASDIFASNFQRAKEATRCLEEFSKLINSKLSNRFKKIRFRLYCLEKETLEFL